MPIYQYYCQDCQNQVDLFFRSFAETETKKAICPTCQSENIERLVSKVSVLQAGRPKAGRDASTGPPAGKSAENSKDLAGIMRQAQDKAGQNLGREFKEVASRLERGEKAASIEQSLRKRAGQNQQTH